MCTLIIARDVVAPRTLLLAANRDEDPGRPSDPPGVLRERPRLVGGRDAVAGGTWLAIREGEAAVALLNRRDPAAAPPVARRSRGLLTLDVAGVEIEAGGGVALPSAGGALASAALRRAQAAIAAAAYAPFTLVYASVTACWALAFDGRPGPIATEIPPGWHVLTHADLDDESEPRTAHLLRSLAGWKPAAADEALSRLADTLRSHGEDGAPPVCLHDGRMTTVSSSLLWMDERGARYLHADGRPCQAAFDDHSPLLGAARSGGTR